MFKDTKQGETHYQNDNCDELEHNRWSPCMKEVVRLSVNELLPFEQIEPFKRLASILDNKVKEALLKEIEGSKNPKYACSPEETAEIEGYNKALSDLKEKLCL